MPRKSTKVVADANANSEIVNVTAPVPVDTPASEPKKRAPVKRANKKEDSSSQNAGIISVSITEENKPAIQISDSVNTFNIHIKHVSDDGKNIENTFSTTYTHTTDNRNGDMSSDSSISSDDDNSDGDSDYDTKFTNSSLTPSVSSATSAILSGLSALSSSLCEDANPLYTIQEINYDILIPFVLINMHASSRENIMALLHTTLISCIEGRCITEGFIKPHSTRIIDFKCGKIVAKNVQFNIVIECLVCNPQPQSIITCVAKNITQAGIRAVSDDEYSPIVVYITRDFGIESDKTYYNSIKEGDKINVRVIGKRFEMNDKHIQIIGFLVQPKKEKGSISCQAQQAQAQSQPQPKKPLVIHPVTSSTSIEKKEESVTGTSAPNKRGPRKTKNPLSIVNDTDNNVITITYDGNIDLPKAAKTPKPAKEPKAPKEPKAAKVPKEPKEPKEPKKSKKESLVAINVANIASVASE